ncbi:MAG: nucleotidyl transferase AbiEii/AbiGii toxin family protein [Terriglobia bacterium]
MFEDDGSRFDPDTVDATPIREDADYGGVRISLMGYLERARVSMQVDVRFGDALVPSPEEVSFPTILNFPAPRLRVYRRETVVAEKFQAMVMLAGPRSNRAEHFDQTMLCCPLCLVSGLGIYFECVLRQLACRISFLHNLRVFSV